jgi:hypothetical protein
MGETTMERLTLERATSIAEKHGLHLQKNCWVAMQNSWVATRGCCPVGLLLVDKIGLNAAEQYVNGSWYFTDWLCWWTDKFISVAITEKIAKKIGADPQYLFGLDAGFEGEMLTNNVYADQTCGVYQEGFADGSALRVLIK